MDFGPGSLCLSYVTDGILTRSIRVSPRPTGRPLSLLPSPYNRNRTLSPGSDKMRDRRKESRTVERIGFMFDVTNKRLGLNHPTSIKNVSRYKVH